MEHKEFAVFEVKIPFKWYEAKHRLICLNHVYTAFAQHLRIKRSWTYSLVRCENEAGVYLHTGRPEGIIDGGIEPKSSDNKTT